jgi:hypothetical protein
LGIARTHVGRRVDLIVLAEEVRGGPGVAAACDDRFGQQAVQFAVPIQKLGTDA